MREIDKYVNNVCAACSHLYEVHELRGYQNVSCIICDCGHEHLAQVSKQIEEQA
ncbi:MAG: hypothetical protein ACXAB7_04325 [Candidatus Kariarchaeaceae archaeon]